MKIVTAIARMNPPTSGHALLVEKIIATAAANECGYKIFLSKSHNTRNPLKYDEKVRYVREAWGDVSISELDGQVSVFDALINLRNSGYDEVIIVAGDDRIAEYKSRIDKYNGALFDFKSVSVISSGTRTDVDASATAMRAFAESGDIDGFIKMAPSTLSTDRIIELYNAVRHAINNFRGYKKSLKKSCKKYEEQ